MNDRLTAHAKKVLAEREILVEWLERTLNEPVLSEPDPNDASLERPLAVHPGIRRAGVARRG